jgi:predicted acyltransferase
MWGWGVLGVICVAYFIAAVIVLNTKAKTQAIITAILLLGYWAARALIGIKIPDNHTTLPPAWSWYFAFSTAGTANVLIGVLAGHWLRSARPSALWKSIGLAVAGIVSLVTGYAWDLFFPIIRFFWASSYVLVACGYSLLLLAAFYWLIELKQYRTWAFFFIVIVMNPLLIYMLQKFVDFNEITAFFLQGIATRAGVTGPIIMASGVLAVIASAEPWEPRARPWRHAHHVEMRPSVTEADTMVGPQCPLADLKPSTQRSAASRPFSRE